MLDPVFSVWYWFGLNRPGFFLGTLLLLIIMGLMYSGGVQASLSLGPGGDFPDFRDLLLYAFSHDEFSSILINAIFLLLVGPCQERRWGTVAFLTLSVLSMAILPPLYTLVLFICGGEASRISGYSATQLALFTAQCRQVTQRRLLRCMPVWLLPWFLLLLYLLLLPNTPALFHFCAICVGHNFCLRMLLNVQDRHPFIGVLQELEYARIFGFIPDWACVLTSTRYRLPTYTSVQRSEPLSHPIPLEQAAPSPWPLIKDSSFVNQHAWLESAPSWPMEGSAAVSEAQLLDEQMLRAGIQASLQDVPEDPDAKVEVPKSSVSSLRLQQLEKMGFPTEKAVVALAASKQLDGAISLLIDDRVGEQAVVVSKGKCSLPLQSN